MAAIVRIDKEVYVPSPEPRVGTSVSMCYIGSGLRRQENRSLVRSSDWSDTHKMRYSDDNGRTWSAWEPVPDRHRVQGEYTRSGGPSQGGTGQLDPVSGRLVKPVFERIVKGDPQEAMAAIWRGDRRFSDHGYYQLSADDGKTWDHGHLLKYEDGPDFDPASWGAPEFWRTNEMYIGACAVLSNGTIVISATVPVPRDDPDHDQYPAIFPNDYREGCVAGAVCFVGRWNPARTDYDWQVSEPVSLPRRQSSRGLVELNLAELDDGNLLLLMRGSNAGMDPVQCPARKWYSVSRDGGLIWSPVSDIRYDTGATLYSPASISTMFRSRVTGKLHWMGNIPEAPPEGNGPRYPLQLVEIDERIPAFKKDTLTVVDDRHPGRDSEHLQLSNFTVLEDRETGLVELYLTRLGERGGGPDVWTADAWRYVLRFE